MNLRDRACRNPPLLCNVFRRIACHSAGNEAAHQKARDGGIAVGKVKKVGAAVGISRSRKTHVRATTGFQPHALEARQTLRPAIERRFRIDSNTPLALRAGLVEESHLDRLSRRSGESLCSSCARADLSFRPEKGRACNQSTLPANEGCPAGRQRREEFSKGSLSMKCRQRRGYGCQGYHSPPPPTETTSKTTPVSRRLE